MCEEGRVSFAHATTWQMREVGSFLPIPVPRPTGSGVRPSFLSAGADWALKGRTRFPAEVSS